MNKVIDKIRSEAEPFQNARGFLDERHGLFVASAAISICDNLTSANANREIVFPAAIMHDIGYFQCTDEELVAVVKMRRGEQGPLNEVAKVNHMRYGAKMAFDILERVGYNSRLTAKIVSIIARHDIQDECTSLEESIVRDADKIWRYSLFALRDKKGFSQNPHEVYTYFLENLKKPNYFFNSESKLLAEKEMAKVLRSFVRS